MEFVQPLLFGLAVFVSFLFATERFYRIYKNIRLGKDEEVNSSVKDMLFFALGQKKMFRNIIPAVLHGAVYVAFLFTTVELIEIFIDGFTGKHRVIWHAVQGSAFGNGLYVGIVSLIEILSVLAFGATFIFLARRNLLKIPRFVKPEMKGWPKFDGNIILYLEIFLILAVMTMNGADEAAYRNGIYGEKGSYGFAISSLIYPIFSGFSDGYIIFFERLGWWMHILVVFAFLNYLPFSKHLHIMLAFPNTFFSRKEPKGEMTNMPAITNEIKMMMDPSAAAAAGEAPPPPDTFGAKDVRDLGWKSLLDAYTCTECGRCTSACPANQTGKLLSPRKIMMDTRDRLEEVGAGVRHEGPDFADNKSLLGDYITKEELRACTTCNACVEECPVNISPLSIILELRRHLIMDAADSPEEWTMMFNNIENNGAPWQFSPSDRAKWVDELK